MKEKPIKKALQVKHLRFSAGVVVVVFAEKNQPDRRAQHPQ
jgi:hypothetical protein